MSSRTNMLMLVALLIFAGIAKASPSSLPPLPSPGAPRVAEAPPSAWAPMWGTAPAAPAPVPGVVKLPCTFVGTKFDRATWDRKVKLDMTACRGLQFHFYCPDPSPIANLTFYFHSGKGWYAASFGQQRREGWTTVTIDKADTQIEGETAGWGAIDILRISAWRAGGEKNTECYLANLALAGADAPIAILRAESAAAASRENAESVSQFSKGMARILDDLGLDYGVMSDLDATPERLKARRILILPFNPRIPPAVERALIDYVNGGGKIVSFYTPLTLALARAVGLRTGGHILGASLGNLVSIRATSQTIEGMPPAVAQRSWNITHAEPAGAGGRVAALWFNEQGKSTGEPAIVVTPHGAHMTHVLLADDQEHKLQLMLALLGQLEPGLWRQAAQKRIDEIGRFGSHENPEDAMQGVRPVAHSHSDGSGARNEAAPLGEQARQLAAAGKYPEAIAAAGQARAAALKAYCAAAQPAPGEQRAWWCHSAFGVTGMTWDEAVKTLADNGFTAVIPNMLWGGVAYYESAVLPVAPEVKEKGDQIALCLAACRKYGVACHVWKVNWNMSSHTPKEFSDRMRREGRTQVDFDGKPMAWLCPSHPANQQLEIDSMVEVATKYDVDGIHFDYIRYPGENGCFCPGCRERFEKYLGKKIADWPAATRNNYSIRPKWYEFRRANITTVVAGVAERLRKDRPKTKISAAVFRNWAVDRDGVGQDWKVWCDRGYLDFVCPMDYTPHEVQFESQIRQQMAWAGKVPVYPGIGLSVWGAERDIVKLIDFINIARRTGAKGFTIFNYDVMGARSEAPLCGLGVTRK